MLDVDGGPLTDAVAAMFWYQQASVGCGTKYTR
jgi:hypothetical protein